MAERFDMSFKNKELKMWLLIMVPITIIGSYFLLTSTPSTRHYPFGILLIGYAFYYSWRYRFRKKKKENKEIQ
ncbi:hypothetical protein [Metaplanococcus flavidus]|uniref:Uncharacterized protein n=1 Tax=Metaplanococcus flavidus TaxID=569883 RepID=A0ABW3L6V9_9BACL